MKIHYQALAAAACGVMLLADASLAWAAGTTPGGGEILRQIQPVKPPAPSHNTTGITIPKRTNRSIPPGISFPVSQLRITGNTLFDTATLHALVADGEGKQLDLKQLSALADRISAFYHKHGYALARAVLPAQEIDKGVVKIRVLEARYGKIALKNTSRVRGSLIEATLSPLRHGDFIEANRLSQSMLLLSDIPGIAANATLKAGKQVGTSDMNVDVRDLPMVTGELSANNFGNRYTGRARGGLSLRLNNPLHLGDQLRFDGVTTGKRVNFGRLGYEAVLNGYGTRVGAGYALMHYTLGGTLSNLGGYGRTGVGSLWLHHPLHRGRTWNAYARLQYDFQRLRDRITTGGIRTDRDLQSSNTSLSGDVRDHFIGGGITTWNLQWTWGRVTFSDASAATSDASTARTAGHFVKWSGTLSRLQRVMEHDALWLSLSGQWSGKNLDSVEKMVVGGSDSIRAYDVGVLSADDGYLLQAELRHRFTPHLQLFALFDIQHIRINHHPWQAGSGNNATLSGAGGGIRFSYGKWWQVEATVAKPVGQHSSLVTDPRKARVWGMVSMGF